MKKIKNFNVLLLLSILITSCATISYTPKVSLDVSTKTIKKSVSIEKFKDISPIEDREKPFSGISVTNKEALSNDLDIEVTNAITTDFSTNSVFKEISRRVENPDYIIKGDILKFKGVSELSGYAKAGLGIFLASDILLGATGQPIFLIGYIPVLTWYFGVPVRTNTSEIEIKLYLFDTKNNLIGTYIGKSQIKNSASMYNNNALAVPSQTNKAFSEAINQIREQILNDITKIE